MIIQCDKCGKTNVEETCNIPEQESIISMTQYANTAYPIAIPAVYYIKLYKLKCKDCGYEVTYSR